MGIFNNPPSNMPHTIVGSSPPDQIPLVSIITVCFNSERYIEQTLLSVLSQTYENIEYVVIDGLSTDGTLAVVNGYKALFRDRMICLSEPDNGIYDAMNKGIDHSHGEILAFLNSDDTYNDEGVVNTIVEAFQKNPDTDWVFGNFHLVDGQSRVLHTYNTPPFSSLFLKVAQWCYIYQPTVFLRRHIVESIRFETRYKMAADYDFFLRIGSKHRPKKIRHTVTRFRIHNESLSSRKAAINNEEMVDIKNRHGVDHIPFHRCLTIVFSIFYRIANLPVYLDKALGIILRC